MRLEKRPARSAAALVLAPTGAVAFTLVVSALLVLWAGAPVLRTYGLLFQGGFGSVFALSETLTRATPLVLTGLAATVAFKARLFNIGAEGQLYAGAIAAIAVGGLHGGSGFTQPPWLLFPLMMAAAALAGALLLLGPAWLKLRLGVDEVVTTLLLNFIVLLGVGALLDGPMKDPTAMGWPQSVALQGELELAKLIPQTRVHTGLVWAIALAAMLWALMKYSVLGFDIRALGANARAAAFAGVPVTRTMVAVALLSGALAGALLLLGPAWLKLRLGVDEVVTTLLLNFIVLLGVGALLDGPMKDPAAMGWPQSVALQGDLELSKLIAQTRVHSGLAWAVALAAALWALMKYTVLGFDIRALGANARAAAFAGVPVTRTMVAVALLSGALAGLAGAIEVAGRTGYVTLDMSPGYGYGGIVIAMLAGLHPLGVLAAGVFVAGVMVGADTMSRAIGVPTYIADVIVAASLIAVLVATLLTQYRVRWK